MPQKNNEPIRVVAVPRDKPDLSRIARVIVALALKQLETDRQAQHDPSEEDAA